MKEPDAKPAKYFYSFGPFRFYPKERELFREGEPVSLAPRATDTLLHLVSRRGHVVDKDELLKSVWGETFVEEANVAHQVGQLRRMLGETPEGNPYIETIPRRGYRFSARVTESWEEGETAGGPVLIEDQARIGECQQRGWRLALFGVSLIVVLGGLIGIYLLLLKKQDLPEMAARPLTTYPGNEAWPSFSPDGSQVAFGWKREKRDDFDIHVAVVGSEKTLQLTDTPDWDIGPVWSPDGRQIAFDRSRRDGRHGIYVVSPLGGPERLVAELKEPGYAFLWPNPRFPGSRLSWSPDGTRLAYSGIWLLSVETGEKRRLTAPPPEHLKDTDPAFSPDGRSVAFVRRKSFQVGDIYVVSQTGGETKRLTTEECDIFGLCWTLDGREIVFSSDRSGTPGLWRVPASGGVPHRIAEASEPAWSPTIARQGARLAFTRQFVDLNVWRAELPVSYDPDGKSERVIASTKTETAPQVSPDGKRVSFTSDRSGMMQVWICDRDGSNAFPLTSFSAPGAQLSAWSPDGRYIAFNSALAGNWDIYVAPIEGGVPLRLTTEPSDDSGPSWSRDGRWVYFGSNRTGREEVWKVPPAGGAAVQVTKGGGYKPVESPDGRFLYFNKGSSHFDAWKMPVGGGEETPVLTGLRSRWALGENGIYLFDRSNTGRWFVNLHEFTTGSAKPVAALSGMPATVQAPAISPDGRALFYVGWDLGEADLMVLENFH